MPLPTIPSGNVASALGGAYEVANSVRFNDDDGPILSKSTGTPSSRRIFTFSCWAKRSSFNPGGSDPNDQLFSIYTDTSNRMDLRFQSGNTIDFYHTSSLGRLTTNRRFRDPASWYHVCLRVDTTQSTAGNRYRLYVNGTQETSFSTETQPSQDSDLGTNFDTIKVGDDAYGTSHFDGYLAEVCYCDGQSYAPTEFGEFDEDTPTVFKPKDVSGLTFGTNGFYLDFEDSSNLGNDANGGTDLTETNLAAIDSTTDTPTNNFCTINPLDYHPTVPSDLEGNTVYNKSSTGDTHNSFATCTMGVTAGKWYYELKLGDSNAFMVGWVKIPHSAPDSAGAYASDSGLYTVKDNGSKIVAGTESGSAWNTVTTNDIIGLAYDFDNLKFYISKNGTWENSGDPTSGSTGTGSFGNIASGATYVPMIGNANYGATSLHYFNFGNPAFTISSGNSDANGYGNFEYSVPSGYLSLCSINLGKSGG